MNESVSLIEPNSFESDHHFYPKVLNAHLHPMVSYFLSLSREQLVERYVHLNPMVSKDFLHNQLAEPMRYFYWGGNDLFYVTTDSGNRKMIVLETNSCPSGQKSMPSLLDTDEYRGYKALLEHSFLPALKKKRLPDGKLAVIYDKNKMESSGYAATLADLTGEAVYLIPCYDRQDNPVSFSDGVMYVSIDGKERVPIRAALRYVTQRPWNRIPFLTKTFIFNPTLICLSGGRNKLMASKAYEFFNSEIQESGLKINTPNTIRDVSKVEVPLWVEHFGGYAVIKNPYSNAGQGVYTITSQRELDAFMAIEHTYDQFIVQSLIGHYDWSSSNHAGKFYHIGTVPTKKHGSIYVADLRMMVYSSPQGFSPCAIYARKARSPLLQKMQDGKASWDMLGTNLSIKLDDGKWESDTSRLLLMDKKDFNTVGIGLDDLIEAYIQTILSISAIDKMAQKLLSKNNQFKRKLFSSLDPDPTLLNEILI